MNEDKLNLFYLDFYGPNFTDLDVSIDEQSEEFEERDTEILLIALHAISDAMHLMYHVRHSIYYLALNLMHYFGMHSMHYFAMHPICYFAIHSMRYLAMHSMRYPAMY